MSEVRLQILMLRRFADPETGVWETSVKEIANLLLWNRSTVQKALRWPEREGYVHLIHRRLRTVRLIVCFGGFPRPYHKKLGLPPLRWDRDVTLPGTETEQQVTYPHPVENSAGNSNPSSVKPKSGTVGTPESTVPTINDITINDIGFIKQRSNDKRSSDKRLSNQRTDEQRTDEPNGESKQDNADSVENSEASLTSVQDFTPASHEEDVVKHLAEKLGEQHINSFLALHRAYGLDRLQHACGLAQDKLQDRKFPLRKHPGAYVRWLLKYGKC